MNGGEYMTQNDRILNHMKEFGNITQLEALKEYGIMRLASRINNLKNCGYAIQREMCLSKNRYGEKVIFAKYSLVQESKNQNNV